MPYATLEANVRLICEFTTISSLLFPSYLHKTAYTTPAASYVPVGITISILRYQSRYLMK